MPKPTPFVPKPALDKLPLAVRKDIRDRYESKKEEFEGQISEYLGKPCVLNFNANEIWAYNPEGSNSSAGNILQAYADGLVYGIKTYAEKYGDDGKTHFHEAVTKSEFAVAVNELGDKAPTITADVKDGVFRVLFKHDSLGYNASYIYDHILPAIENVPREGFSLKAKASIEAKWESEVDEITQKVGEILNIPDVKLDPNFEENYKQLSTRDDKDWHQSFGHATTDYFDSGLIYQLGSQGFKGDEMLQEGLAEAVPSKTFKLRVIPKLKKGYNEVVIEDGVVYLQTDPKNWYVNTSQMGTGLVDLL